MDSTLAMVTVFKDRAQLFHAASIALAPKAAGEEITLVFPKGQWSEADRSTLQVNVKEGAKDIILRSVQFRTIHSIEDVRPQKQLLRNEIEVQMKTVRDLRDQLGIGNKTVDAYKKVLDKVNGIARSGEDTKYDGHVSKYILDPAAQDKLVSFVVDNVRRQLSANRELEDKVKLAEDCLNATRAKLTACGGDQKRTSTDVAEVQVVALAPTNLRLLLSYLVRNASWTPVYDLRVDSKKKTMGVHYNAMVKQSSMTNWDKVQLELSTASPHVGGNPPTLSKWNISLRPPYRVQAMLGAPPPPAMMMQQMMMTNMMPAMGGMASPAPPPAPKVSRPAMAEAASIACSSTSTTFTIAGKQTVRSDNTDVKVTIMQSELPVHLRYSAVPKLDAHTYLKAKAINTTGCILLPGRVNTFADNQFIGKSEMDHTGPDDEFWTFLGVDDDLTCTRKLVHRKFADKSGFLGGKRTRVEYKYIFTAKNSKRTNEEIVVWDQFPMAEDKKLNVVVTTPSKESTPAVRFEVNNLNAIEWFWDLKPKETQTFEYVFHVDYPSEENVTGLVV